MKKFYVLADSTCDCEKKFRDRYDFDYCPMVFTIDSKTYKANLDWTELKADDYYGLMRKGKRSVTGLVSAAVFEEKFTEYLEKGFDVLYIACSSRLSGSLNNAKIVAAELKDKYPDRKIVCFDSLRSNYAQGMMALDAAKMANSGMDIEECVKKLTDERLNYITICTAGSLTWLKQAGRVKAGAAFFGNLIGVKPMILADAVGQNYAFKKVKGRKASLDELVTEVSNRILNPEQATVFVEHANCIEDAKYVGSQIKDKLKVKEVNVSNIGPIVGATVGPDTITVNFYGKTVTEIGE